MCQNQNTHPFEAIKNLQLSRRDLLKSSLGLLAGAVLPRLESFAETFLQVARKRIYIANDDHTDYFWAGDAADYRQAFIRMLDYYLDLTDTTATEPPQYQSRWNCDGSFWVWEYEKNKTPAEFNRLIAQIRSGHITMPLNALAVCLGGTPAEAVLRGMYYPGQLERRYNLRFPLVISMENQTLPYGLISLWNGAGAHYSWKGICNCDTFVNAADRDREIYWCVGPDGSRILMKWNSQLNGSQSVGGYAEAYDTPGVVEYVDTDANFIARYPYRVIGAFGKGWDNLETLTDEFVTVAKAKTNAGRQVIVSNEVDFFLDFESSYGGSITSYASTFGNDWDVYCASLAEVAASAKRSVEKLRAAEALAALVSIQEPAFMASRVTARDQVWMDLGLFWEHNWGVVGRVTLYGDARAAWQRQLATRIRNYVDSLQNDAANRLASMIPNPGPNVRFYAFNPLSWSRTDFADFPYTGPAAIRVVDVGTGAEVPSQIITRSGQTYLRVLAENVPSVGYKVFEIQPGAGAAFTDAATVTGNVIENDFYRITVSDTGAITSLIDKTRGNREFVRTIGGLTVNDLGAGAGTLQVENAGPVSVTLHSDSGSPLSHVTRITLIRDSGRIDIQNEITENFRNVVTWAFSFELNTPDVWHEEVGAIIRAKLLAQGGHYAPRNARYDWLTLNHFADMTGQGVGVTLSNSDTYFMRLGNSTVDTLDVTTPQISVLAGGIVGGGGPVGGDGRRGIPDQGGDTYFLQRFALQTHGAFSPLNAMRFALEHQNPLVTEEIPIQIIPPVYPEPGYSLVNISNSSVILWSLKPGEDIVEEQIVARLWNISPTPQNLLLNLTDNPILGALRTTHIETPISVAALANGALNTGIGGNQFMTFAMSLTRVLQPPVATPTPAAIAQQDPPPGSGGSDPMISLTVDQPFAVSGDEVVWTITVTNTGSQSLTNVDISGALPDELTILRATSPAGPVAINGQSLQILLSSLLPGQVITITARTRIRNRTAMPFIITGEACLFSAEYPDQRCAQAQVISAQNLPQTGWSRRASHR